MIAVQTSVFQLKFVFYVQFALWIYACGLS